MVDYEILEKQIMEKLKKTDPTDEKYAQLLRRLSEVEQVKDREEQVKERKEAAEFDRTYKNSKLDIEQKKNEHDAKIQEQKIEIEKDSLEFDKLFKNSKMDAEFERNSIEQEKNVRDAEIQEQKIEVEKEKNKQQNKLERSKNYNEYGKIALKGGLVIVATALGTVIEQTGILGKALNLVINTTKNL